MIFTITPKSIVKMDDQPYEVVERKGIGHPDTLADLIAETFSCLYSQHCLEQFGGIPNHWVDKILLSGAKAELGFGRAEIIKPINAYLFGKVTNWVGGTLIDVQGLFQVAVQRVFQSVFGSDSPILNSIQYFVDVNDGIGADHPENFYSPLNKFDLPTFETDYESNDTATCTGYAEYSSIEKISIALENYLNSQKFKQAYPETGYDIKVLVVRKEKRINIVVCIPFIANKTPHFQFYQNRLKQIEVDINYQLAFWKSSFDIKLHLNTKDKGRYAYLTTYGTALDKGDIGAVGRGNRYNGIIPANREVSMEAVNGKNPLHHAGKLYNVISFEIANCIAHKYQCETAVHITTFNGSSIRCPEFVYIKTSEISKEALSEIEGLSLSVLNRVGEVSKNLIFTDPIAGHVCRTPLLDLYDLG